MLLRQIIGGEKGGSQGSSLVFQHGFNLEQKTFLGLFNRLVLTLDYLPFAFANLLDQILVIQETLFDLHDFLTAVSQ